MERLKDQSAPSDPVVAEAAALVRSVRVPDAPVGLEERIRARLTTMPRSPLRPRLRSAWAIALALGIAALAGATVIRRRTRPATAPPAPSQRSTDGDGERVAPPTEPIRSAPPATTRTAAAASTNVGAPQPRRRPSRTSTAASQPARALSDELQTSEATSPSTPAVDAPAEPMPPKQQPQQEQEQRRQPRRNDPQESILVLNAAHALRSEHDAKRATKLLDEYLRRYPDGDLVEEGLALAVEARAARNDARAATLAREYLRRFPAGRFRDEARRAVDRFER
jgi:hypothetical protein